MPLTDAPSAVLRVQTDKHLAAGAEPRVCRPPLRAVRDSSDADVRWTDLGAAGQRIEILSPTLLALINDASASPAMSGDAAAVRNASCWPWRELKWLLQLNTLAGDGQLDGFDAAVEVWSGDQAGAQHARRAGRRRAAAAAGRARARHAGRAQHGEPVAGPGDRRARCGAAPSGRPSSPRPSARPTASSAARHRRRPPSDSTCPGSARRAAAALLVRGRAGHAFQRAAHVRPARPVPDQLARPACARPVAARAASGRSMPRWFDGPATVGLPTDNDDYEENAMSFNMDGKLDPDEALRLLDHMSGECGNDFVMLIENKGAVVEGESNRKFEDGKKRMALGGYSYLAPTSSRRPARARARCAPPASSSCVTATRPRPRSRAC